MIWILTHHIWCKLLCDGQDDPLKRCHEVRIADPGTPPGHVDSETLTDSQSDLLSGSCAREELTLLSRVKG